VIRLGCFAQRARPDRAQDDTLEMLMLHEFIAANREDIIDRCRAKVATRSVPPPTKTEIEHGVPVFLDQLVAALRVGKTSSSEIGQTAVLHGHHLLVREGTPAFQR
jgi:hypothetical protein